MSFRRSIPTADTRPSHGEFYRLSVEHDPDHGLLEIADERVTSGSDTAQVIEEESNMRLHLTPDEARWLARTLAELVAELDAAERGASTGGGEEG